MATKKKSGGSVAALKKTAAGLRAQIAAHNKKQRDAKRAEQLKKEVEGLRKKLRATTGRTTTRRKRR